MIDETKLASNELLRGDILKISENAEPLGAGTKIIKSVLSQHGFNVSQDEVRTHCRYLQGKGLIEIEHMENKAAGISRDIVHITPKGIDVLEGREIVTGIELSD